MRIERRDLRIFTVEFVDRSERRECQTRFLCRARVMVGNCHFLRGIIIRADRAVTDGGIKRFSALDRSYTCVYVVNNIWMRRRFSRVVRVASEAKVRSELRDRALYYAWLTCGRLSAVTYVDYRFTTKPALSASIFKQPSGALCNPRDSISIWHSKTSQERGKERERVREAERRGS